MSDVATDAGVSVPDAVPTSTAPEVPQVPSSPVVEPPAPEVPQQPQTPTPIAETPGPDVPQSPDPIVQPPQENAQASVPAPVAIKDRLYAALEKIQFRKRAKLDKILALAAKKKSIKNDDVEKLLRVSDATASRYLAQLVKEGRLKRFGRTTDIVYESV